MPHRNAAGAATGAVLTQSPRDSGAASLSPWLRTLRALRELPARADGGNVEDVCHAALDALDRADIPFATIYTLHSDDPTVHVAAASGPATTVGLDYALLREVVNTGAPTVLDPLPPGWADAPGSERPVSTAMVLPVYAGDYDVPATVLVAGVAPHRVLDDDFRTYLDLIADQIGTALAGITRARATDRSEAVILQHTILDPTALPHGFAVRYTPAVEPRASGRRLV